MAAGIEIVMAYNWIFFTAVFLAFNGVYARAPSRIVGGEDVTDDEFTYVVSLQKGGVHICGGGIIDTTHILTAGHCVSAYTVNDNLTIAAGITRLSDEAAVIRKVKKIHLHPEYHHAISALKSLKNDIAVITLDSPLPLASIKVVDLPEINVKAGTVAKYAGWGSLDRYGIDLPDNLQKTTFIVVSQTDCKFKNVQFGPERFCTLNSERKSTLCDWDSGSPLVSKNTVIGVTSSSSCNPKRTSAFFNVFQYLSFIKEALKD